jgi:hypothetical protein
MFELVNDKFSQLDVINGLMMAHLPKHVIIYYIKTHADIDYIYIPLTKSLCYEVIKIIMWMHYILKYYAWQGALTFTLFCYIRWVRTRRHEEKCFWWLYTEYQNVFWFLCACTTISESTVTVAWHLLKKIWLHLWSKALQMIVNSEKLHSL